MPRLVSTLLVVALLAGTATAFGITQGLKAEKSPIYASRVAKVLSPVCDCATRAADIWFTLRKPDRVAVEIVRGDEVVRVLVEGKRLRRGVVHFSWNGRDDQGRFVPDGVYRPRVHLDGQRRTIVLPNEMRVDTTPPDPITAAVKPKAFSPDGDGKADRVRITYGFSEHAHAILAVDGRRVTFTRAQKPDGSITWNGKVGERVVRAGRHVLQISAQDLAGNVGGPVEVPVEVRYVELARSVIRVKTGARFGVRVSADADVRWRLARRSGTAKPGVLVLRAPTAPGRYTLVVSVGRHQARARVLVRQR